MWGVWVDVQLWSTQCEVSGLKCSSGALSMRYVGWCSSGALCVPAP